MQRPIDATRSELINRKVPDALYIENLESLTREHGYIQLRMTNQCLSYIVANEARVLLNAIRRRLRAAIKAESLMEWEATHKKVRELHKVLKPIRQRRDKLVYKGVCPCDRKWGDDQISRLGFWGQSRNMTVEEWLSQLPKDSRLSLCVLDMEVASLEAEIEGVWMTALLTLEPQARGLLRAIDVDLLGLKQTLANALLAATF